MDIMEIVLLAVGGIVFILSFLIPARKEENSEEARGLAKEEIKTLVSDELEAVRGHVDDVVEEAVTYSIEKTERSLERLSNEKIMAVNEYSDTVLAEIHKNHEEVMFLYDMLNDKHINLKNTVSEIDRTVKEAKETKREAEEMVNTFQRLAPETIIPLNPMAPHISSKPETVQRSVAASQNFTATQISETMQKPSAPQPFVPVTVQVPEVMPKPVTPQLSKPVEAQVPEVMPKPVTPQLSAPVTVQVPEVMSKPVTPQLSAPVAAPVPEVPQTSAAEALPVKMQKPVIPQVSKVRPAHTSKVVPEPVMAQKSVVLQTSMTPQAMQQTPMTTPAIGAVQQTSMTPPMFATEPISAMPQSYTSQPSASGMLQKSEPPLPSGAINFTQETDGQGRNYNDRILELYKEGKSNVAIARELNLGVGEVKLVIDLYRNRSGK